MSIVISTHTYDGFTRMRGEYIRSWTFGFVTVTIAKITVEAMIGHLQRHIAVLEAEIANLCEDDEEEGF